jgi:serine/threonine transporter
MNTVKTIFGKTSLIIRIVIGIVIGIILGFAFPDFEYISILGDLFVGALKAIAPILVFMLIMSSVAKHISGSNTYIKNIVVLYFIGTFLAAITANFANLLFHPTLSLQGVDEVSKTAPKDFSEVLTNLLEGVVTNPLTALSTGNYLSILFWSIIFGFAIKLMMPSISGKMGELADVVNIIVRWVINCAPIGIIGLVYTSVAEAGVNGLLEYGQLILVLVGTMLFVALIIYPFIVFLMLKKNPFPLIVFTLKESAVSAFFTRSSAANIPMNLRASEKLGLTEDSYSISIPLGATINMGGAAITISIMTLAAVNTLGIDVNFGYQLILCILSALAAAGASGVAGGSLLLIPLACNLFGIDTAIAMQIVGVGFIIGVIQDSVETALNSSADLLWTATSEFRAKLKHDKSFDYKATIKNARG